MFLKHQAPTVRLEVWRNLRHTPDLTIEKILTEFARIKHEPRCIDYYTPASWPSVFEIVSEGYFCQSGITLVLTATLHNAGFITSDTISFPVISNHTNGLTGLVLEYDNCIFNAVPGEIISKKEILENSTVFASHTVPISQLFS